MDINQADKYRKIIRILGLVCALGAAATAFIFRLNPLETFGACMASRILSIALFVLALGLLVFDLVTKAFSPKAAAIGLVIALVGFVGSFIVAPGSSMQALTDHIYSKAMSGELNASNMYEIAEKIADRLELGSYLVMAAGLLTFSYNIKCMKSGA